jgi:hypothetical protein
MAAVLTSTGLIFSDSSTINSKYGIFPQTTAAIFYQAAAPTGWATPATVHNNRALRVVSGTAGGTGGTNNFTTTMASRPVSANVPVTINGLSGGNTTLSINQIPTHVHPANRGGNVSAAGGGPARVANSGNTGGTGNNGAHAHPLSANAANGPINTSIDFRVQYIDVIYCTFS